uniref:Uncharacterized protein n=1 Tax=Leersia perrieri TaxID=77586 RepID=A0A0D9W822_9ORYZ
MRATVANLRGPFLQFCQGTDAQRKDAALEIQKGMKALMKLYKEMELDLSVAAGPTTDEPATGDARNMPDEKIPSGEKNQVPLTDQTASCMHNSGEKVPLNPVISEISAERPSVEIKREGEPSVVDTKMPGQRLEGSYVVGGSPTGWNFFMWPGSRAV